MRERKTNKQGTVGLVTLCNFFRKKFSERNEVYNLRLAVPEMETESMARDAKLHAVSSSGSF